MYTALYRKWRPKAFSDVIGQNHITDTLKNEIKTGRLSHAYLFIGSRGTGKTTCARILAKAVNCPNVHDGEPCNECEICKGIDSGSILDITEIDAASNNGVDNIRDLREEAAFTPVKTKFRVYIIDEVHMLSQGAFNALLKTLEEPPEHVKFILATTEAHKMPATILSRCQRFDFKRIGSEDMSERLLDIAEKEGISLTTQAALLISRLSDGAMRDALSITDQCIARSKDIDTALVSEVCGIAGKQYLAQTAQAIYNKDTAALLSLVSRLYADACDMERYCSELINYFRNIMVARAVKNPEKLIVCSAEDLEEIVKLSQIFTLPASISAISALQQTYADIKSGVQGRTAMEMALIKLASPDMDTLEESVLKRIAELENSIKNGVVTKKEILIQKPEEPKAQTEEPKAQTEEPAGEQISESAVSAQEEKAVSAPEPVFEKEIHAQAEPEPTPEKPPAEDEQEAPTDEVKDIREWPEILQEIFAKNRLVWTILNGTTAKAIGATIIVKGTHPAISDVLSVAVNAEYAIECANAVTGKGFAKIISEKDADEVLSNIKFSKDPLSELVEKAAENGIKVDFK